MKPSIASVRGTIYFIRDGADIKQGYDVAVVNPGPMVAGEIAVSWERQTYSCGQVSINPGESAIRVYLPDIGRATNIRFHVKTPRGQSAFVHKHKPQRHWTVHIVQFAHHDPGYTDLPSSVFREYLGFHDDILRFCSETDDYPDESRFRYTVEQGWSLLHWLEHRPAEMREEMMRRIREGRIEVNAFLANETTELLGPEQMVRMLYPVFALKRKHGIGVVCAEHNDIPGISWGAAAAMAAAGVRYFAPALPDYFRWKNRSYHTFWDEEKIAPGKIPHAFYWEAPNGERVLFWYGRQGAAGSVDVSLSDLPAYLERLEESEYPYDVLRYMVMGIKRDNAPPKIEFAQTCREWNENWAYPRFVQSLNARFFPELEKQLARNTPTYRGELPGTDYCIGATCTAHATGVNRVAHDTLLAAERFAAIASQIAPYEYPAEKLAEAYYCALMYDEHCWGLAHPVGPGQEAAIAQKCEFAHRAAALSHDVLRKAVNEIANHVAREDDACYIVVFNPLDRPRTDLVTLHASPIRPCSLIPGRRESSIPPEWLQDGLQVIDDTGESVPHEIREIAEPLDSPPYAPYRFALGQANAQEKTDLRFVAEGVSPLGYKTYKLVPARPARAKQAVKVGVSTLENRFYRVKLDPKTGAIRSIYDKQLRRELVDQRAKHDANQIVIRSSVTAEVFTSGKAIIERGHAGPVCGSLIVRTSAPGYPQITQEITLYADVKRIDIANRLLKDPTPQLETFFAFPFAFRKPKFAYEGPLCVVEPMVDQFPGSNTDYHAIQHWASVRDSKCGVSICSLDAPVMQFGGNWPLYVSQAHHCVTPPNFDHPFHTAKDVKAGHIYSLALLNNYVTNLNPTQSGDLLFRYSIASHAGDCMGHAARDFGYAVSLPLEPVTIHGIGGTLPGSGEFCRVEPSNVILLALKRAEDGDGFIVRLLETEGVDSSARVTVGFLSIDRAYETNLVEENQGEIAASEHEVVVPVKAWSTATVRLCIEKT